MGCTESSSGVNRPRVATKDGIKTVCLQFCPVFKDIGASMAKADALLDSIEDRDEDGTGLDLIVLPEMAFSGYRFQGREDILPFTEPDQDISAAIAASLANGGENLTSL